MMNDDDGRFPPIDSYEPIGLGQSPGPTVEDHADREDGDHYDDRRDYTPAPNTLTYERGARPVESLPFNVEAEAALIGACLIDNRVAEQLRNRLWATHFFEPVHGRIYEAILSSIDRNMLASPITLAPALKRDPALIELGGLAYLAQLTGSGAVLIGASDFADQVIDLARRRALLDVLDKADEQLLDTTGASSVQAAVDAIDTALSEAAARPHVTSTVSVEYAWDEAFDEMEGIAAGEDPGGVLIDEYEDWNVVVGRMQPGDLIYLGGRPSMGKTGVAVKVMMGCARRMMRADHPDAEPQAVELLSLEMNRKPIMQRVIADAIYQPGRTSSFSALTEGKMTSIDRREIARARESIEGMPLHISDPATMTIEGFKSWLRGRIRAWARKGRRLSTVIVDYLGRFSTTGKFNSTGDRVTHISNMLKSAAKEMGVVLIVLVQLSRALESRDDKRPLLSDLRDSGSLEQDADVVVFVYRDQYYLERGAEPPRDQNKKWEAWDIEMRAARDRMWLIGAKRRQGGLFSKQGYFYTTNQAIRSSETQGGYDLFETGD